MGNRGRRRRAASSPARQDRDDGGGVHQVALRLVCDVRDGDGGPKAEGEGELDAQREHPKLGRKFHRPSQRLDGLKFTQAFAFAHPLSLPAIARVIRPNELGMK